MILQVMEACNAMERYHRLTVLVTILPSRKVLISLYTRDMLLATKKTRLWKVACIKLHTSSWLDTCIVVFCAMYTKIVGLHVGAPVDNGSFDTNCTSWWARQAGDH